MKNQDIPDDFTKEELIWDRDALEQLMRALYQDRSELPSIIQQEIDEPAFNPLKVRNMIRNSLNDGHDPSGIVLGKLEAASFHHFVCRGYGEESGSELKEHYFMGLLIFEDQCPSRLELIEEDDDHKPDHTSGLAA